MRHTARVLAVTTVVLATVIALPACGGGSDVTEREIVIDIQPQGAEGTTGTLSLAGSGDATSVVVEALVPSGGGQQAAAFYKGTCQDFDQASAIDVGALEEGDAALTLERPIEELLDGGYVLVVHRSPEDDTVIGCAPIQVE